MTETIELSKVSPHPKSVDMYGEPVPKKSFVDDVDENGIRVGIVVTENSHYEEEIRERWGVQDPVVVLSGHKRIQAATECGMDEIKVAEWVDHETKADEFEAVRKYNDYRDKTFSQRMREGEAIEEIAKMRAKRRMKSGGNPKEDVPGGNPKEDVPGGTGQSRDEVADEIGIGSGRHYSNAKKIWGYYTEEDEHEDIPPQLAEWMVDRIDQGEESITGSYNTLRDLEKEFEEEEEEDPLVPEGAMVMSDLPDSQEKIEYERRQKEKEEKGVSDETALDDDRSIEEIIRTEVDTQMESHIQGYIEENSIPSNVVSHAADNSETGEDLTNRLRLYVGDIDSLPSESTESDVSDSEEQGKPSVSDTPEVPEKASVESTGDATVEVESDGGKAVEDNSDEVNGDSELVTVKVKKEVAEFLEDIEVKDGEVVIRCDECGNRQTA